MQKKIFVLTIVLAMLSLGLNAQEKIGKIDTPGSNLKTDLQGTYPQHIEESNWWEGAWVAFGTKDMQYFANGDVKEIESADGSGKLKEIFSYDDNGFNSQLRKEVSKQYPNNQYQCSD